MMWYGHFLSFPFFRTIENKSAEISIDTVKERLVLIIQPSQENKLTKIEMHKADCLCDRSNHGNRQSALYTPLQIENGVTNQMPDTSEYLTVTEWTNQMPDTSEYLTVTEWT